MRLQGFQILVLGLILSCSPLLQRENEEERISYIYYKDSLVNHQSYKLIIANNGAIIIYKYLNLSDSSKNMTFNFDTQSKVLTFNKLNMEKIEKDFLKINNLSSFAFDLYAMKIPVTDGWGSIMFNQYYGILNIGVPFTPYQNLFLPASQLESQLSKQVWEKYRNL
jgi:hypothetical protein